MADTVEIVFKTRAELEGALAAQRELEKTRGKLLALGESTAKVDQQLAGARAVIAQAPSELSQGIDKAGESFQRAGGHGESFRRVISGISRENEILGSALHIGIHPIAGALLAAVVAVRALHERFAEMGKHLAAGGGFVEFKTHLEETQKLIESHGDAVDKFVASLVKEQSALAAGTAAFSAQTEALKGAIAARNALTEATREQERAQIDVKVAKGQMSPEAAALAKLDLEHRNRQEDRAQKIGDEQMERGRDEMRLQDQTRQKPGLQLRFATASDRMEELISRGGTPDQIKAGIEETQKNLDAAVKQFGAAQARIVELEEKRHLGLFKSGLDQTEADRLKETLPGDEDLIRQQQQLLKAKKMAAPGQLQDFADASVELKSSETDLSANSASLDSLTLAIQKLTDKIEMDQSSSESLTPVENATHKLRQDALPKMKDYGDNTSPDQNQGAADKAQAMDEEGYSRVESAARTLIDKGLSGNKTALDAVIQAMETASDSHDQFKQSVIDRINQLQMQFNASRLDGAYQ